MQNNKLLDENARLAVVHKQLAEELEIARNASFSRMNLSVRIRKLMLKGGLIDLNS